MAAGHEPGQATCLKGGKIPAQPRARTRGVKNWLEGPNQDIDRIIRSVSQAGEWKMPNKLAKEFLQLLDTSVATGVVDAVKEAFSIHGSDTEGEAHGTAEDF